MLIGKNSGANMGIENWVKSQRKWTKYKYASAMYKRLSWINIYVLPEMTRCRQLTLNSSFSYETPWIWKSEHKSSKSEQSSQWREGGYGNIKGKEKKKRVWQWAQKSVKRGKGTGSVAVRRHGLVYRQKDTEMAGESYHFNALCVFSLSKSSNFPTQPRHKFATMSYSCNIIKNLLKQLHFH